jgi:nicotinate-nucleotide pyrophosphorylase (carboxylating)
MGNLPEEMRGSIVLALREDLGSGDVTSRITVAEDSRAEACLVVHEAGIVAGLAVAEAVFRELDPRVDFSPLVPEGGPVTAEQRLAIVCGQARAVLSAERTALNYLGRMCGIATLTHTFVAAVAGTSARILDTRKTAPGLRAFDKLAVRSGGGENHRFGLYDMILIKDNHIDQTGSLAEAVRRAQAADTGLEIEVEARSLEDVRAALGSGARRILLDNMTPELIGEAVALVRGRARLEASGNVRLDNVRRIAETGVDDISIGALTHSVKVLDISLEITGATTSSAGGSPREEKHA